MAIGDLLKPRRKRRLRELQRQLEQSGLFDPKWYVERYPDTSKFPGGVLLHYLLHGMPENRSPGPRFDPNAYLERHSIDGGGIGANAMEHYLLAGQKAGSSIFAVQVDEIVQINRNRDAFLESGLFDAQWYREIYDDLRGSSIDALEHFVSYGSKEGRNPGPRFDAQWYTEEYLLQDGNAVEPLVHYLEEGRKRGYATRPESPFADWRRRYFTLHQEDLDLLAQAAGETAFFYLYEGDQTSLSQFVSSASKSSGDRASVFIVDAIGSLTLSDARGASILGSKADLDATIDRLSSATVLVMVRGEVSLAPKCAEMLQAYAHGHANHLILSDFIKKDAFGDVAPYFIPCLQPRLAGALDNIVNLFAIDRAAWMAVSSDQVSLPECFSVIPYVAAATKQIIANQFLYEDRSGARPLAQIIPIPERSPSVSIIIPTKDGLAFLKNCIDSIENMTVYEGSIEIIIVDNVSKKVETLVYLRELSERDNVRVLQFDDSFNFASINNMAAEAAKGDVLVLLNNDTAVMREDWLSLIVAELAQSGVGAVGAKLLYPDGSVQHGGVVVGIQGIAAHSHTLLSSNDAGFQDLNRLTREVSAVTGACLAMPRDLFRRMGGFDTNFLVAFNDIALCHSIVEAGYRVVFIATPLLYHHESKSRGYDTTPEKIARFYSEKLMFRRMYWHGDQDPHYSRSLSLQECYALAEPPRGIRPWRLRAEEGSRRKILVLSSTYQLGHGVAVVIEKHVERLLAMGFEVWLGGPAHEREISLPGVRRIYCATPEAAAKTAVRSNFDLIIAHTPPFFSVVRFLEDYPAVINYDYGEPPAALFPDRIQREEVDREKVFCFAMSRYKACISAAVRAEMPGETLPVLPLANSHLARWTENSLARRDAVRARLGWSDKFVVLNVCRFYAAERNYKGVSDFIDIGLRVKAMNSGNVEVVLCGRGTDKDIDYVKSRGVQVFPNVSDEELIEIYLAADAFVSMSKWEGYNLPIAQALAVGLPVLASKIPAHEAFGVETFEYHTPCVHRLNELVASDRSRNPKVWEWDDSLDIFADFVSRTLADARGKALASL